MMKVLDSLPSRKRPTVRLERRQAMLQVFEGALNGVDLLIWDPTLPTEDREPFRDWIRLERLSTKGFVFEWE